MSGGKGGSSTTKVEIPKYLEDASRANLAEAKEVSRIGNVPLYGPQIAAFNDAQVAARQNVNDMAAAFGMQGAGDFQMPEAVEVDGVRGYETIGLYDQALAELEARRPGQYAAITSRFLDPFGDGSVNIPGMPNFSNMTAEELAAFYSRMGGFRV